MSDHIHYQRLAPGAVKGMLDIGAYLGDSSIEPLLRHLVELRVSQINGCAFCADMHARQVREAGDSQQRMDCLATWREAPFFTERERAAFDWAETLTHVSAEQKAMEAARTNARKVFSEQELVDLSFVVSTINAWNRLAVGFHIQPPPRHE